MTSDRSPTPGSRTWLWIVVLLAGMAGLSLLLFRPSQSSGTAAGESRETPPTSSSSARPAHPHAAQADAAAGGRHEEGPADGAAVAKENSRRKAPEKLADLDRRASPAAAPTLKQQAALAELRKRVPGVDVRFDPVTGSPDHILATGHFLTPATAPKPAANGDATAPARQFMDENAALFTHGAEALQATKITRDDLTAHNGMHTVVWQQQVDEVPVYNTVVRASLTRDGELITIGSNFLSQPEAATQMPAEQRAALIAQPPIDVAKAISLAAANLGDQVPSENVRAISEPVNAERRQRFEAPAISDTNAGLAWLPMNATSLNLTWDVTLMSLARSEMFRVLVDARTGEVLMRTSLTADADNASYRVFAKPDLQPMDSPSPFSPGLSTPGSFQPAVVSRNLLTLTAYDDTASPNGWLDPGTTDTQGNNVDAHTDIGGNNTIDLPRPTSATRVFDFSLDLSQAPSVSKDAAVVQLFYYTNFMHDRLYELGFTESAGNFQTNNFGRGGLGNDRLLADGQDGSGTNNANFSTPSDGSSPRMQMFLWTGSTPARDGDFDGEVVLHEYTHGLSNRLVGGGVGISANQTRGMGEGWSDFYELAVLAELADDVNGVWARGGYSRYHYGGTFDQNYYFGGRRYPYTTDMTKNPLTLKDIDDGKAYAHPGFPKSPIVGGTASEVHNAGEVWCVTLWEARANLITKLGYAAGSEMILKLLTDGMKLSPANPNFLQARDAVIQADLVDNAGANKNELWAAFAKRGMGFSATSPASTLNTGIVETYDVPGNLGIASAVAVNAEGPAGGSFAPASRAYVLTNNSAASLDWTASHTQSWTVLSSSGGTLAPGASTTLIVSFDGTASAALAEGGYMDVVTIADSTSGVASKIPVTLAISAALDYGHMVAALPNDGSTSSSARAPTTRSSFERGVYLITAAELSAHGFINGAIPKAIGWTYVTAPGLEGAAPLTVYLQNTADTTNTKSTTWSTAISGMTVVHNATTNLPNVTGSFDIPFTGGSAFTYTGGGLYVAFDWGKYTGTLSTTNVISCNSGGLVNGLLGAQSTTSAPTALSASSFRPETRLSMPYVPTITAPTSANITATSATLGGNITRDWGAPITARGVVYARTSDNSNPQLGGNNVIVVTDAANTAGVFTENVGGLSAATSYSFAAYATNISGTSYTAFATFTTAAGAPSVGMPTHSALTVSSATLGGNVTNDGGDAITERGVVYSLTAVNADPIIGGANVTQLTSAGTIGVFTVNATGLSPGGGYSFKAYAINSLGTTYTSPVSTFIQGIPTVTTPTSTNIMATNATLGGNVTSDGGLPITERGVVYSATVLNADPVIGGFGVAKATSAGTTGVFTATAISLSAGTNYSFKAYATNSAGTTYTSPVSTFNTLSPPTVTSPTATNINVISVTFGGNVTSDGGATITERGIVYSTTSVNANPAVGGSGVTKLLAGGTTGSFSVSLTGLTQNTNYSFRAYAINAAGTGYTSPVSTFTTLTAVPLTGTKTVGATGNYTSLTNTGGLFEAINNNGVNGQLNVQITSDLSSELGTFSLNAIAGSTPSIKIFPTSVPRTISGSTSAIIRLNGADQVTLDGSLGGAGTDRSLTITNTSTSTSSAVIWLQSTGVNGATNNVIKNINVTGSGSAQTLVGIGSGSATISITSLGSGNNSNTIQNNNISKVQYGIFSQGASTASKNTGNIITGNLINTATPNNVGKIGILLGFENNVQVTLNKVDGMNFANSPDTIGISLGMTSINATSFTGSEVTNATVTRNTVGRVTNTGGSSATGIAVASATSGTTLIANNFISGVAASGTSTDIGAGIFLGGGTGSTTQVYFNSVAMTGTVSGTQATSPSYALAIGGSNPVVNVRNNVLMFTQVTNGTTPLGYAIGTAASTFTNLTSDYNLMFTTTGALFAVGKTGGLSTTGTTLTNLANWQQATTKDVNSVFGNPLFSSSTDLHVTNTSSPVSNAGTPIAGTTTDFDGDTRNSTLPDIGADEFSSAPVVTSPTQTSIAGVSATLGGNVVTDGGVTVTERGVVYSLTSANANPLIGGSGVTRITSPGTTGVFTVNASSLAQSSGYSFKAYATNSLGTTYTIPVSTFTTLSPLENWRVQIFGAQAGNDSIAGNNADPNHNGIPNFLEYALNGDAQGNSTGTAILPQASPSGTNHLQVTFFRYLDRNDITLTVQGADSPAGPWTDLAGSISGGAFSVITTGATVSESGSGNQRTVVVGDLYLLSDSAHPRRFLRLKVSEP